jgi:hypothetical protein
MVLPIKSMADWRAIDQQSQKEIGRKKVDKIPPE